MLQMCIIKELADCNARAILSQLVETTHIEMLQANNLNTIAVRRRTNIFFKIRRPLW